MPELSDFERRLQHVRSHAANPVKGLEPCLNAFHKMQGNPKVVNSINGVANFYRRKALLAWFDHQDAHNVIKMAWLSMVAKRASVQVTGVAAGRFTNTGMLYCLLSNEKGLIHWMSQYLASDFFEAKKKDVACNDPSSSFFNWLQLKLAVQGDWQHLVARAHYFLNNMPKKGVLARVDCKFYIALAQGDIGGMEEALAEMVSPKVHRIRGYETTLAYEQGIISTWGVMLSKVAWLHGYKVDISHPLIPSPWLPTTPLDAYDIELDEFKEVNMFEPFAPKNTYIISDLSQWSPRPLGEAPLSYAEACEISGVSAIGA